MGKRILSVDLFRGLTIAFMILVNNPGTWAHIYRPLDHAEWFGTTPTDWIFPFFLFIVGTSIVLAYMNRPTDNPKTYKRIISRTLKLFLLGWLLGGFKYTWPFFRPVSHLRIPGVLVRIGFVFFMAALIFLFFKYLNKKFGFKTGLAFLIGLFLVIEIGYWYVMIGKDELAGGNVSELIQTKLNKHDNLASQLDRKIFGVNHMWRHWDPEADKMVQGDYDPEGFLSSFPALATAILGIFLGLIMVRIKHPGKRLSWFVGLGILLIILGELWKPYFPYAKKLWTSSYVLYMGGLAFLIYALLYLLTEFVPYKAWTIPFVAMGMNAIAVFVLNGFIAKSFYIVKIHGKAVHSWIYHYTWGNWIHKPETASLMYALSVVLFYVLISLYLYRKKIFFKV